MLGFGILFRFVRVGAPGAGEEFFVNGEGDQFSSLDLGSGDPGGDDADAHAGAGHFLDGAHVSEAQGGAEFDAGLFEVSSDQAVGFTGAAIDDEGFAFEEVEGEFVQLGPGMGGGDDEEQFVLKQGLEAAPLRVAGLDAEGDVEFGRIQKIDRLGCVARFDVHFAAGKVFAEFAQDAWQQVAAKAVGCSDTDAALAPAVQGVEFLDGGFQFLQDPAAATEKDHAVLSDTDAFSDPVDEFGAQLFLQATNGVAHRGLGEAKFVGCLGETGGISHFHEGTDLAEIG